MIRTFLGLLCFITLFSFSTFSDAAIEIGNLQWDFGRVTEGEKAVKKVAVSNSGDKGLRITDIRPDCECLTAEISSRKIPPGGRTDLTVTYDSTKKHAGEDIVNLSISSVGREEQVVFMTFYATVAPCGKVLVSKPEVPTMTSTELRRRIEGPHIGRPLVLDVRIPGSYNIRHIPGAESFPRKDFEKGNSVTRNIINCMDTEKIVVVYCSTGYNSSFVVKELIRRGYDAYSLDGMAYWTNLGYPVETYIEAGLMEIREE